MLSEFCQRVRAGDRPAIIVDIARRHQTSAAITAKIVLEEYLDLGEDKEGGGQLQARHQQEDKTMASSKLATGVHFEKATVCHNCERKGRHLVMENEKVNKSSKK